MTERFTYAPDLAQQMRREAMRRVGFWSLFVAVFWSGGIVALIDERSWLGPLIALGATGIVVVFESVLRQVPGDCSASRWNTMAGYCDRSPRRAR